jgi:hypothetical protein
MLEPRRLLSSTIDVMVVYTPQALAEAGSVTAIDARIHRAIAETNFVLAQSGVNAGVRLVHEAQVNYTESGILNTDLNRLQAPADGYMDNVQALRNQYGADLVSLWVGSGDEGGRAFQPDDLTMSRPDYGFNIVQEQYAVDNFIFAHETAHNLGAGHDRTDPTPRNIPYAYGKEFRVANQTVGDIMSDTERVPYYSNPNITFRGVPVGNADNSAQPADNAHVMNEFAPIVAAYRPTVVPDTSAPVAALDSVMVNAAQQTLSVKVQYADDSAVALSSLHTGNVIVTGPNGFNRTATFEGVDIRSNGPIRDATYQVSIAGFSADPNAYAFTLQPGQVRDVYGHVAGPTRLGAPNDDFPNRAGPRTVTARDVGNMNGDTWRFNNAIDSEDPTAFYRFSLTSTTRFAATLTGLSANLDEVLVQDKNGDGQVQQNEILVFPALPGTAPESIAITLPAGTYYLWVAPPVNGTKSPYTLTMSASAPTVAASGSISGRAFDDVNANGVWNAGESASPGWRIYIDRNNNGVLDPGEASTVTDASGNYHFTGLSAGRYLIKIAPRAAWRQTFPTMNWGTWVNLAPGQIVTGINFGETPAPPPVQPNASISGAVFDDLNGDKIRESDEGGLAGFRVYIDANNDGWWEGSEPSTLTDANGNWTLGNLTPGAYRVRVLPVTGWKQTVPFTSYLLTVTTGQRLAGILFGQKRV